MAREIAVLSRFRFEVLRDDAARCDMYSGICLMRTCAAETLITTSLDKHFGGLVTAIKEVPSPLVCYTTGRKETCLPR